jgi:hypothetical protein
VNCATHAALSTTRLRQKEDIPLMEKFKRTIAPDARPICGRIALHQRLRAQSHDLEIAIYLRVTSKYLPVIGAKIPVNLTREFASERPVSTGLDHPADAKKKAEIGEFALLIPVTPHFRPETGSQQTASTASKSLILHQKMSRTQLRRHFRRLATAVAGVSH